MIVSDMTDILLGTKGVLRSLITLSLMFQGLSEEMEITKMIRKRRRRQSGRGRRPSKRRKIAEKRSTGKWRKNEKR